ncbi:hypothetical protein CHUAL_006560 [Chamberlinius hualienensis]
MLGAIVFTSAAVIIPLYILRKWFAGGVCKCKGRLEGKTVIITGANSGIGKETALILAGKGARVVLACRNLESANEVVEEIKLKTQNESAVAKELDLASFASIRKFADEFIQNEKQLDILINNAGVYYMPKAVTEDGFDVVYQTNYLGHFLLTYLLIPLIKKSAPSRIINVSSVAYRVNSEVLYLGEPIDSNKYNRNFIYAKSKLAQILFTKYLAYEMKDDNVTVNALHPGMVLSSVFRHFPPLTETFSLLWRWPLLKLTFKNVWQGAQTTVHCAVSKECSTITGQYFKDCAVFPLVEVAENFEVAVALWTRSLQMCGLTNLQNDRTANIAGSDPATTSTDDPLDKIAEDEQQPAAAL